MVWVYVVKYVYIDTDIQKIIINVIAGRYNKY